MNYLVARGYTLEGSRQSGLRTLGGGVRPRRSGIGSTVDGGVPARGGEKVVKGPLQITRRNDESTAVASRARSAFLSSSTSHPGRH